MDTVYNASKEYTVSTKEIPQMSTLTLLPEAKPQTLASVLICTEPNHMLPVVNIKPDRTMANETLPGAKVKLKKTLIINSIQCSTRDERRTE